MRNLDMVDGGACRRQRQKALCEFKASLKIHSVFPGSKERVTGKHYPLANTVFELTVPKTP